MRVAHVCNYAPCLSGMYGTVRDLLLAEKKCGLDAEFIDDAMLLKHLYGKDGITPVSTDWGDSADIICWHHAMVQDWLNEKHRNLVLFLHGTPEFNLFTELYDDDHTLSLIIGLANKDIPRAYVSMWKRHVPIWENMLQKKVHYIPPWTTVNEWKVSKKKVKKDVIKIAMMDFWRTTREPFGLIQAIEQLKKSTDKKVEVDVWGLNETPNKTWQAVIQWMVEEGTMTLQGRSSDVQKDIYDKSDMIVTMSTEETRVVREAYSAGVPVVCGRAKMGFTKYAEDSINPNMLAGAIKRCHHDLCDHGPKLRKELRKYAEDNFDAKEAAKSAIKIFEGIVRKHGSINKPKVKSITSRLMDTAERIKERLVNNQASAYVNFTKDEIKMLEDKKIGKGLVRAFKFTDKTRGYFPCLDIGMVSEGRMRPHLFGPPEDNDDLVRIAKRHKSGSSNRIFESANALSYMSVYNPTWFVDMLRKCIHNKRVMFIGKKMHCKSAVVKCAFDVNTFIEVAGDFGEFIEKNRKKISQQAQVHDIVICARLNHHTCMLGYSLWSKGIRTTFIDIGHIADAMCGIRVGWAGMFDENYVNNYRMAFLPEKSDIVIVTHDNNKLTKRCFDSVAENTDNYRVIWSDNGSDVSEIKKTIELANCDLIRTKNNEGYSIAANKALRKSIFEGSAEWIVTLDNDTVVTRNWLLNMINTAVANDFDIVSPIMSHGVTSIEAMAPVIKNMPEIKTDDPAEIARILATTFGATATRVSRGSLACCLMSRKIVEQIGLFDENLFVMGVETDFFQRALRLNAKVGVSFGTYVHHDGAATVNNMSDKWRREEDAKSKTYLNKKWKHAK